MRIQKFLIRRLRPRVLIFAVTALTTPFAADAQNTQITLPASRLSAEQVFDHINRQTPYKITANKSRIADGLSVRIDRSPVAVSEVLNRLFDGTGYTYSMDGNMIILPVTAAVTGIPDKSQVTARILRNITGIVTDSDGNFLEGVRVEVVDSRNPDKAAVTFANGRFRIAGVTPGNHILKLATPDGQTIRYREVNVPAGGDADVTLALTEEALARVADTADTEAAVSSAAKTTAYFVPTTPIDNTVKALADEPKTPYSFVPYTAPRTGYLPQAAIKTNLLYLATTTLNIGAEFGLARRWTLDVSAMYNPFRLQNGGINLFWYVQPEVRYWFCQRFEKHFIGLHALGGAFNIGEVTFLTKTFEDHRYKGWGAGAGLSYGYHMPVARRWAMEFTVGAGYVYLEYDKFRCYECDEHIAAKKRHYFGPTKAGVSLMYMIK